MLILILINLTVLLLIATVILHFSSITSDPKWERYCGQALLFTVAPIIVIPAMRVMRIPLPPLLIAVILWLVIGAWFYWNGKSKQQAEDEEMKKAGNWKCSRCGTYNQKLMRVCWKCSAEKPTDKGL